LAHLPDTKTRPDMEQAFQAVDPDYEARVRGNFATRIRLAGRPDRPSAG
jgi:hypothetical protein